MSEEREKVRHLLVIEDLQGQQIIPLQEITYLLGRDSRNAIVLRDPSVSRQHAILLRVTVPEEECRFRIIDGDLKGKKSTNGLLVNGTKCSFRDLQHGDFIEFGKQAHAQYCAISNLLDQELADLCAKKDLSRLLSNSSNPFETVVVPDATLERDGESALVRLASYPELIPNPITEMDLDGNVTYLNPAAAHKFPKLREMGTQHPLLAHLSTAVQNQDNSFIREVEIDGEIFEQFVYYLPESELIRTFVVREITEQKQAHLALRQRDKLLQAVAEATNCLLAEMDYTTAINQALTVLGQATEADCVYFESHPTTEERLLKLECFWTRTTVEWTNDWRNQSEKTPELSRWCKILASGQIVRGLTEDFPAAERKRLTHSQIHSLMFVPLQLDGQFWGAIGLIDCQPRHWSQYEESALLTMAASISGAHQRQQVEQKNLYRANHDLLTQLPNRQRFNEQLGQALSAAARYEETLAVMFLDLDRFKTINDTLGHTLGDQLLRNVAQRLRDSVRAEDMVARWGGDEFIILLPRLIEVEEATQVATRILHAFSEAFQLDGHELSVSASLGIALFNEDSPDAKTLVQHADTALYWAKEQGRDRYEIYSASENSQAAKFLALEKSLRHALQQKEFVLYYQPRINLETKQIVGMEALLRWQSPEMGLVAPSIFIPVAEESGLIVPLGEWALREACAQNQAWQSEGLPPLKMAVNLSPKQFLQPNIVEKIANILAQTGLKPEFLELEITETTALHDLSLTQTILEKLEQMGIDVSIDDFGTGHSSLSRLQLLPLHNLKIDQSFIRELFTNAKVAPIVKAIVSLGQSLGLKLTAEGVETEEELEFLRSIHCDDVQGFFFHRPISAEQATELMG